MPDDDAPPDELRDDNPLAFATTPELIAELANRTDNLVVVWETGQSYQVETHGHAIAVSGLLCYARMANRKSLRQMNG